MFNYNFHTHTSYCDGSSSPEEYVRAAIKSGLISLGFSGHAPVPMDNGFAIRNLESLQLYCDEIIGLKEKYKGEINIFLALEADYIPGVSTDFSFFKEKYKLDYIIGSVHLVKNAEGNLWFIDGPERNSWLRGLSEDYDMDIRKAVTAYYRQVSQMIESQNPDVVGHLDKVKMHNKGEYFEEDETWYRALIQETLEVISASDCIVEVNTRGLYKKRSDKLFPDLEVLKVMKSLNIPVSISSDAHKPDEVSLMTDVAAKRIAEAGYKEVFIFEKNSWKGISLDRIL